MLPPHWPQARRVGAGDASDDFLSGLDASDLDTGGLPSPSGALPSVLTSGNPAASLQGQLQAQVNAATGPALAQYQQTAQQVSAFQATPVGQALTSGAQTVASGGTLSNAQIQAGFTAAATAGAVLLGASAAAAGAAIAPLAAAVFGGGYALGKLVMNLLGITNAGPVACSGNDSSPGNIGASPGDPDWLTYSGGYGPASAPHAPTQDGEGWLGSLNPSCYWKPYTNGGFETWARPIIMRAIELWMNCKAVPPDNTATTFGNGLVATWNAQFPTASQRSITMVNCDHQAQLNTPNFASTNPAEYWEICAWNGDPVQVLMQQIAGERGVGCLTVRVAAPPPPPGQYYGSSVSAPSPVATVAAGAAVVGGLAVAGTAAYAYTTKQSLATVLRNAWKLVVR